MHPNYNTTTEDPAPDTPARDPYLAVDTTRNYLQDIGPKATLAMLAANWFDAAVMLPRKDARLFSAILADNASRKQLDEAAIRLRTTDIARVIYQLRRQARMAARMAASETDNSVEP